MHTYIIFKAHGIENGNIFSVPKSALKAGQGVVLIQHTCRQKYVSRMEHPYSRCSQGYGTSSMHKKKTQDRQHCALYIPRLCTRAVCCGPWQLTFALRQLENLSFFTEIICWAPWIIFSQVEALGSLQFFSTALVS